MGSRKVWIGTLLKSRSVHRRNNQDGRTHAVADIKTLLAFYPQTAASSGRQLKTSDIVCRRCHLCSFGRLERLATTSSRTVATVKPFVRADHPVHGVTGAFLEPVQPRAGLMIGERCLLSISVTHTHIALSTSLPFNLDTYLTKATRTSSGSVPAL